MSLIHPTKLFLYANAHVEEIRVTCQITGNSSLIKLASHKKSRSLHRLSFVRGIHRLPVIPPTKDQYNALSHTVYLYSSVITYTYMYDISWKCVCFLLMAVGNCYFMPITSDVVVAITRHCVRENTWDITSDGGSDNLVWPQAPAPIYRLHLSKSTTLLYMFS